MRDFKSKIAEIKSAYNIVDYIEQSGVSLKQNGVNKWKGLCFVHQEKTPSLVIDEHFQNYHCFGCGIHGDIIKFVQINDNLDFIDAVKLLAEGKGIEFETGDSDGESVDYQSLRQCIRDAANFYVKSFRKLPKDHTAKKQITDRGLSVKGKLIYGYAPEGGTKMYDFLKSRNYSDEIILQVGVCKKSSKTGRMFDFWQGRLMFFIADASGKPVGFSGRKLFETDKMGKYVNSSDGPLFNKSSVLFNLSSAKKMAGEKKEIYVAEGQFDVAAIYESGLENVVASSGTAFTGKQGQICSRLVGEDGKIIFSFDGDSAGREAAVKVFEHSPGIQGQSYVVSFPDGQDPCDYRMENGSEKLRELLEEGRVPLVEFVLKSFSEGRDLSDPQQKSIYLEKAAAVIKTIEKQSLRSHYVKMVSIETFSEVSNVEKLVDSAESIEKAGRRDNLSENLDQDDEDRYSVEDIEEKLIDSLDDDFGRTYLLHRILSFVMSDLSYRSRIEEIENFVSQPFKVVFDELKNHEGDSVLPEHFTYSSYVDELLRRNLFPYMRLMSKEDIDELADNLFEEIKRFDNRMRVEKVRNKISRILSSKDSSIQLLKKAIEKEESLLGE